MAGGFFPMRGANGQLCDAQLEPGQEPYTRAADVLYPMVATTKPGVDFEWFIYGERAILIRGTGWVPLLLHSRRK